MDELLKQIEEIAQRDYDGHYCLFSFTTNRKGFFGPPKTGKLGKAPGFETINELLMSMIENPKKHES